MKKTTAAAAAASLILAGIMAGCGGGGSATTATGTPAATAISGKVADGYLVNAVVFMDKNGNFQLDAGEPSTTTDQNGGYTLNIAPEDVGKYPIVVMAVQGQTIDMDNPGQPVSGTYVMVLPGASVSGTASNFVSPMTTMIQEKMRAGMSLAQATTQLRNQMNLPAGVNMMADYVSLSSTGSTDPNKSNYQLMHTAAQNMASLMAGQAAQVTGTSGSTTTVDLNRFQAMMGSINQQLPQMVAAMSGGVQPNPGMMGTIMANVETAVSSTAPSSTGVPFTNMSTLFPSAPVRFWNMTGNPIQGMMGTAGAGSSTGGMMGSGTGTVGGTTSSGGMMAKP